MGMRQQDISIQMAVEHAGNAVQKQVLLFCRSTDGCPCSDGCCHAFHGASQPGGCGANRAAAVCLEQRQGASSQFASNSAQLLVVHSSCTADMRHEVLGDDVLYCSADRVPR